MQHQIPVALGHCANRLGLHCSFASVATATVMTWLVIAVIGVAVLAIGKKILFS